MPSTYSTSLRLEQQADGENSGTWGQKQNNNHVLLESALSGGATTGIAVGGAVDVTLTASNGLTDQSRQGILRLTGVLTGAISVIVPAAATATKWWFVSNETTGSFALTFKTFAGTGIVIPQGVKTILWCDGTNIVEGLRFNSQFAVDTGASGTAFVVTPGGTTPGNLSAGMRIMFKAAHAATGGASTLNFAGFGTTSFTRLDTTALVANDFISGQLVEAGFDGTRWVLLSPLQNFGTAASATTGTSGHTLPFLDGANTWSGVQAFNAKALNLAKGAAVASAASCDIWTPGDGNFVHITGVTTITSFGTAPQAGATRIVTFDGVLTLTNNANIVLPGAANITTAAGDLGLIVADTTTKALIVVYQRAASIGGKIAQVVTTESGASTTGTTILPTDDTIPQNTEGDEYMTVTITPTNSSSTLVIEVIFFGVHSGSTALSVALFQDTTANALAATSTTIASNGETLPLTHKMTAGTTSATTFKVRAGGANGGTTTFNGIGGSRIFGGVAASSIVVTEILP